MPELPEVETMRRGLLPIVGGTVVDIVVPRLQVKPIRVGPSVSLFRRRIRGRTIADVRRRGKRLLVILDDHNVVLIEPRMTGLVVIADPPDLPHVRATFSLQGTKVREFSYWDRRGLGSLEWMSAVQLESRLGPDRLGPDALEISVGQLRERLSHSRRPIKVALLDQQAIAGIGNLYASEILHVARIHPSVPCQQIDHGNWQRIQRAIREVLSEAIHYEGSTLSDGTYRNALNNQGSYQHHHRVYDRAGQVCSTCQQGVIVRMVQSQRSSFYCTDCQPS